MDISLRPAVVVTCERKSQIHAIGAGVLLQGDLRLMGEKIVGYANDQTGQRMR
jgi:hypothetical protein